MLTLKLTEDQVKEILINLMGSGGESVPKLTEDILHQCVEQDASDELLDYARDAYNEHNI